MELEFIREIDKTTLIEGLVRQHSALDESKILLIENSRKCKYLDFFLEVLPTVYEIEDSKKIPSSMLCILCAMVN